MRLESLKIHPFTDEDVLRYLFVEMSEEESQQFEQALDQSESLNQCYEEMLDCLEILNHVGREKKNQWSFFASGQIAPYIYSIPHATLKKG